jgi:hypothetical protein
MASPRLELARTQLDAYRQENGHLNATWGSLETKSQGTAAVAGIFLAAVFAFVRDLTAGAPPSPVTWGLLLATGLLVLSVVGCLRALWRREVLRPPLGDETRALVADLLEAEEHVEQLPRFYIQWSRQWATVNDRIHTANESKAYWLLCSQLCLLIAILIVGAITIFVIVNQAIAGGLR